MAKDEFDWEDFDEDEFFDDYSKILGDDMGESKSDKKGIKQFFKNAVKSVGRGVTKLGKAFMPEAADSISGMVDFGRETKDSLSEGKDKIMKEITGRNMNDVKITKSIADTFSSAKKDILERVKTGNFVKAETFDMDAFMDDEDEGEDEEYSESSSPEEQQEVHFSGLDDDYKASAMPEQKKKSYKQVIIQQRVGADKKAARAVLTAGEASVKAQYDLFNKASLMAESRHNQSMAYMRNIMKNVYTLAASNSTLLKVQMEFGRKNLAMTADMLALMKELHQYQTKLYGKSLGEMDAFGNSLSPKHSEIFGMGFDGSSYFQRLKENVSSAFQDSMIGQLWETQKMMGEISGAMGGKKKGLAGNLMGMIDPARIFGNFLFGDKVKQGFEQLNKMGRSLPQLINNKLLKSAANSSNPILNFIASMMGIRDQTGQLDFSGKAGSRDLKAPAIFDNQTWATLNEVIPGLLSQIAAGVTGKEQVYYDYDTLEFKTISSMQKRYEKGESAAFQSDFELVEQMQGLTANALESVAEKDKVRFSKGIDTIFKAIIESGEEFDEKRILVDKYYKDLILEKVNGSEAEKHIILMKFLQTYSKMSPEDKMKFNVATAAVKANVEDYRNNYVNSTFAKGNAWAAKIWSKDENTRSIRQQMRKLEDEMKKVKGDSKTDMNKRAALNKRRLALMNQLSNETMGSQDIINKETIFSDNNEQAMNDSFSSSSSMLQKMVHMFSRGIPVFTIRPTKKLLKEYKMMSDHIEGKTYDEMQKRKDRAEYEESTLAESMKSIIEMQKSAKANREMLKEFSGMTGGFSLSNTKVGHKINAFIGALLTLGVQGTGKLAGYNISGADYNYIPEDPQLAMLMMFMRQQNITTMKSMQEIEELNNIIPANSKDEKKIFKLRDKLFDLQRRRDEIAVKIKNEEKVDPKIEEGLDDELLAIQWEIAQLKGNAKAGEDKFWEKEEKKRRTLYEKDIKARARFEKKHAKDKGLIKAKYKHSKAFREQFKVGKLDKVFKKDIADVGYDKITWIKPQLGVDKVGYVWLLVTIRDSSEAISILRKNNFGYGSLPKPETNAIYISPDYMKMSGTEVDPLDEWEDEVQYKVNEGIKLFFSMDQLRTWVESGALYDVSEASAEFDSEKNVSYVQKLKNKRKSVTRDKIISRRSAQGLSTDEKSIDEAMSQIKKKQKIKGATLTDVLAAQLSTKNTLLKGFAALTNRNEEDFDDKKTGSLESLVNANPIGNVSMNLDNTVSTISAEKDGPEKWVRRELKLLQEMNEVLTLIYTNTLGMNGVPVNGKSWEIIDKIKEGAGAAWGHVKSFGRSTIDFLKEIDYKGIGKGALDTIGSAGSWILDKLVSGAGWLKDRGVEAAGWIKDKAIQGKDWVSDKINQAKTKVQKWKDEVLDPKLVELQEKYGKKFIWKLKKDELRVIVARIMNLAKDSPEIMSMKADELREVLQKYYEENIEPKVAEFKEKAKETANKAKEKGQGLADGIKGFFAGLLGLGTDTASALFDGAKGFLGNLNLGETFKNFSLFGGRKGGASNDMYLKGILQNVIATRIILSRQFGQKINMNAIAYAIDKMDGSSAAKQGGEKVGFFRTVANVLGRAVDSTVKGAGAAIESFRAARALRKENQISKSVDADGFQASEHGEDIREGSREDMIEDKEKAREKELAEDTRNLLAVIAANTGIQMDLLKSQAVKTVDDLKNSDLATSVTAGLSALGASALGQRVKVMVGKITGKFFKGKAGQEAVKAGAKSTLKTAFKQGGLKGLAKAGLKGLAKGGWKMVSSPFKMVGKAFTGIFKSSVTKEALEVGTKVGDLVLKGVSFMLGKFFKNNTIIKKIGQGPLTKIKTIVLNQIKKHLMSIVAKVAPKMGIQTGINAVPLLGQAAWVAWKIADAVIGFTLGYKNAGKHWGVSNSTRLTHGMRAAAGLASALDMCLWGILGLIGDLVGKNTNFAGTGLGFWIQLFYQQMGKDTTNIKSAQEWARIRTEEIYGISMKYQEGFFNYEQAWVKVPLWHMHGCGFRKLKAFNYWVENRYKPLKQIEDSIAKKYGGSKIVHQMDPEGQDELERIQMYRKEFYAEAKKYISANKIAWITSGITPADIKVHEKNKAEDDIANAEKDASKLNAKEGEQTANSNNPENGPNSTPGTQRTNENPSTLNRNNTVNTNASDLTDADKAKVIMGAIGAKYTAGREVGSGQQVKPLPTGLTTEDGRIRLVLKNEGGYCNVAGDSGGPTNYGIAWNYNQPALKQYGITDPSQMRTLDIQIAIEIYKKNYYRPCGAANISDPVLAVHLFDCAVNCGVGTAKKMLAEANKHKNPRDCFIQLRYNHYRNISAKKRTLQKFLKGWLARIKHTNDALGYVYTEGSYVDEAPTNNSSSTLAHTQNGSQPKAEGNGGNYNGQLTPSDENAIAKMNEMANSTALSDIASENGINDGEMMGMDGNVVSSKRDKNGKLTKTPAQHFEDALITELDHLKALVDGQKEQTQAIVTPLVALQATMTQAVELLAQIANSAGGSGDIGNPAIANVIAKGQ